MLTATQLIGFGAGGQIDQPIRFDGVNDYLSRGAGLTGLVDSKQFAFSCWSKYRIDTDGNHRLFTMPEVGVPGNSRFRMERGTTTHRLAVQGVNAAGTSILVIGGDAGALFEAASGWIHLLISVDLADVAKRHVYINDRQVLTVTTYTNDNIDWATDNCIIGARPDAALFWDGDIYDLWWNNAYIDFSVEANRRKFISSIGRPANLGPTGAIPTGTVPMVFVNSKSGVNRGTGGGFTVNGGGLTKALAVPELTPLAVVQTSSIVEFGGTSNSAVRAIGTAHASRIVAVIMSCVGNNALTSVTIDGNAMTILSGVNATTTPDLRVVIAYLPWPTGTTATIAITWAGSQSVTNFEIFSITGAGVLGLYASNIAHTNGTPAVSVTGTLDLAPLGVVLAVGIADGEANAATWSGGAVVESVDRAMGGGSPARYTTAVGGPNIAAAGSFISFNTGVSDEKAIAVAAFR